MYILCFGQTELLESASYLLIIYRPFYGKSPWSTSRQTNAVWTAFSKVFYPFSYGHKGISNDENERRRSGRPCNEMSRARVSCKIQPGLSVCRPGNHSLAMHPLYFYIMYIDACLTVYSISPFIVGAALINTISQLFTSAEYSLWFIWWSQCRQMHAHSFPFLFRWFSKYTSLIILAAAFLSAAKY